MIESTAKVFLIGQPVIDSFAVGSYLREVGGEAWYERVFEQPSREQTPTELLVEFMGRLCYRSWEPGLNRNVTRIREDSGDYLLNILRSRHGSVLEHAVFNFALHDVSRVLTAELNRHKAGTAISEQSLRYVRLDDLRFRVPDGLQQETLDEGRRLIGEIEDFIERAYERELSDDMPFSEKKLVTSKLRRWAPLGLLTEEGWSANVRELRHVIEVRTDPHAEEEVRDVAGQIARIMQTQCPLLFGDYVDDDGHFVTEYGKV